MFGKTKPDYNPDSIPVITYVHLLIMDTISRNQDRLVLRSSNTLPMIKELVPSPHPETLSLAALPPPSFSAISNRLKVLSELIPMKHKTQVNGTFQLYADGGEYSIATSFDDTADDPVVTIGITKVPNNSVHGTLL